MNYVASWNIATARTALKPEDVEVFYYSESS